MSFLRIAAIIVALDQLSKQLIWRFARDTVFVPGFLNLVRVRNTGAAFGLLPGARVFFVVASVAASVFIVRVGMRTPPTMRLRRLALAGILGGAVGNLVDRVLFGSVIDFIQIGWAGHYWPVFNVADVGVSVGAVLLALDALRAHEAPGGARTALEPDAPDAPGGPVGPGAADGSDAAGSPEARGSAGASDEPDAHAR